MYKIKSLIPIIAAILLIDCIPVTLTGSGNVVTQEEYMTR